ncbi:alpha/beta fold hydrolase [Asticcacaulis benevestitus]|uniref:AB hydrolase-1 domain-containing protein n=1 Tax=Asticcacaulis benevestitus DSM 16100 = ATCC BAA-896 TaxID=1121022 RepID=V4PNC6_9CAUL|nr:hypothetical protein [Asticcacaulis benevestitus]ESQ88789.1 hypothetical protein ABENE_15440 [Asticcacaulis benevestitus DSM 16100 = ATCC BAA-896]
MPYTLYDMAADAIGLLDALGIQSAHLVGRSMGGMIADHGQRIPGTRLVADFNYVQYGQSRAAAT